MNIHHLVLAGIFGMVLATGCTGKSQKSEDQTSNLPALKIGAMSSMDYLPFVVANEMGICDSLGLSLEIVKFFSANDRDAAFRAGSVDGTVIDYTGAALQHANGVPLALVMKHDGLFYMMSKGSFASMQELKGKKIAVSRNTVIEYSTDVMLQSAGVEESEVEKVEINKIPVRMQMLSEGEVDASIFPNPFASMAEEQGMKKLMTTRELDIDVTGTIFGTQALRDKGESIKVLMEAYNLGVEYIQTHPRAEWMHLLVEDAGVPGTMALTIELPEYHRASAPDANDIQKTILWLKEKNLVPVDYTGEGLVDASFL